ncbi:RHS repeat-associated core domain-containing protein [Micromonospora sp. NPDC050495]|uniref:RHS repeat-associated core domain-containing protein n=1 Tax=Micromonospora sp. NPDC050495 TaxID=3154936 RepID=UPI0033C717F1
MQPARFRMARDSGSPTRTAGPTRRWIAGAVAAVLSVPLMIGDPAAAAPRWDPPAPDKAAGIRVQPVKSKPKPTWTAGGREVRGPLSVTWPAAGSARVDLTGGAHAVTARAATSPSVAPARARATGLPVSVAAVVADDTDARRLGASGAVGAVDVRLHDQATTRRAGVAGLMVQVGRADGVRAGAKAAVTVDYEQFAAAYGGDWATRLRLVTLPACALTTPTAPGCTTSTPLASRNDPQARSVTAVAPLAATGATVLALTAAESGDNGDYGATSLSPASTWEVSPQTGGFSWSYPLRTVPGTGGPTPSLALSYSSQAIDGRTGGTNTQGSWIGDGWDLWPGYIERSYRQCGEDTDAVGGKDPNNKSKKTGDQCWWRDNATISSNVTSGELVDAGGGRWKGVKDDGSKIELLKNTSFGNGDNDGEYWRVTSTDGTQYYFGRNSGPGGASGSTVTNSTWTTQVYGNHLNEPGYTEGDFAASRRTQAWRWNLDYVVDPHGNTMTFFYRKESGAYGRENDSAKRTTYDRGGWLEKIEYGNRNDAPATTYAAARVLFDVADRCTTGATCFDSGGKAVQASWPDTPWDQYCHATPCTDKYTPTFWTQKRLAKIRMQVHAGGGSYSDVESWALRQEFLNAGSTIGEGIPLYLRGITRTGHVTSAGGAAVADPEVVFDPGADPFANRVDGPDDDRTALKRWRVRTITTETGQQIVVTFKPIECRRSALPTPHTNTQRCFPQYYAPEGAIPTLDWFHKYVVDYVDTNDNTGASTQQKIYYDYLDKPAWHYDDSELIKEKKRTWSQFRGYGRVKVRAGFDTGVQMTTDYRYLRGMDGDKLPSGTRNVSVSDSFQGTVTDHDAYAGLVLEQTTLDGANGNWVSGTINTPTTPVQTAAANSLKAWMTNTAKERSYSRTTVEADGVRWTEAQTKYNADNLPYEVNDLGDVTTAADDTCERTWYARNDGNWMLGKVKRTQTVGVACTGTATFPGDLISESRITYDRLDNDWNTDLPTRGLPVKTEEVDRWIGSTPVWETTSTAGYDANGRTTSTTNALGHTSTTAYTPASAGPVTSTREVNPKGHATTTTLAPAWGLPVATVDANQARTDMTYDGLGRLRQVWLPGRTKGTDTANMEFDYRVRNTKPSAVTTRSLLPDGTSYKTIVRLYDGWLRERQVQSQAPGGGRVLSDTFYDSRGLTWYKTNPFEDITGAAVSTELVGPAGQAAAPSVLEYAYDGVGRVTAEILRTQGIGGQEKWRTTTTYNGDLTTVTPPQGGTRIANLTDGLGRLVERRQYKDATNYDVSRYTYYDSGLLATASDPAGNVWRSFYDQRGRKVRDEDPDKGATTTTYDLAGQVRTVKDARGRTIAATYDELGRKTTVRDGSDTGPILAAWTYDTLANGIGRVSSSTRYDQGGAYVNAVTGYDAAGRSTGTTITLPSSEGALCASTAEDRCSYTFGTKYKADGQPATSTLPAVSGDLAAEQLLFGYNDVGAPTTITSGLGIYVYSVVYDKTGKLVERTLGAFGKRVQTNYTIDDASGRLMRTKVSPETGPVPADFTYDYDKAGNLLRINDTPYGQPADTQCYRYDHLRRLTEAWTPGNGDCGPNPTVSGLGGPAAYWHSYQYAGSEGLSGNRTGEVAHTAAGETSRTYRYPAQGGGVGSKPHGLASVLTDRPTGTDTTDSYGYDEAGNTTSRTVDGRSQTLTWNNEGRLTSVVESGRTVSYLYDADGNRLIRRDPQGSGSTLYLPAGMEVTVAPGASTATCTRYYSHVGQSIGVRTKAKMTWVIPDHHNTGELNIDSVTLAVQRRRTLPFGAERTAAATWAGDKGFLGGTRDATGLTHLGAREYEPTTGRFISVDPVMDASDPQQWNAYGYSNNNPGTYSDPTGLKFEEESWGEYNTRIIKHLAKQGKIGGGGGGGSRGGGGGGGGGRNPARAAYFGPAAAGDVRRIFAGPKAPGNGLIVATFFIQDKTAAGGYLTGDDRGFSTDVNAPYRVAVAWDTDTGEISYTVSASCEAKSGECSPQKEIVGGGANDLTIIGQKDGATDGRLEVEYSGLNSKIRCCSINGKLSINFYRDSFPRPVLQSNPWLAPKASSFGIKDSGSVAARQYRGVEVGLHGDNYPSFQVVQYENNGNQRYLAHDWTPTGGAWGYRAHPIGTDRHMTWNTSLPGAGVLK